MKEGDIPIIDNNGTAGTDGGSWNIWRFVNAIYGGYYFKEANRIARGPVNPGPDPRGGTNDG